MHFNEINWEYKEIPVTLVEIKRGTQKSGNVYVYRETILKIISCIRKVLDV